MSIMPQDPDSKLDAPPDDPEERPCCDYRDHSGERPACACPEHRQTALHPYGYVMGGRR